MRPSELMNRIFTCAQKTHRTSLRQVDLGQNHAHAGTWLQKQCDSIDPFCEVIAALELGCDLCCCHSLVLGQVLGVLPFEVFPALLGIWLPAEMTICRCLLILRLTKSQRLGDGTWSAVESNLHYIRDVIRTKIALLCAIRLHEQGQRFGDTDGIR